MEKIEKLEIIGPRVRVNNFGPNLNLPKSLLHLDISIFDKTGTVNLNSVSDLTSLKSLALCEDNLTDTVLASIAANCLELQSLHLSNKFFLNIF